MEILLNLSSVSGEHDLRGLRRLYNEVEANVRSLKALGVLWNHADIRVADKATL